jgi:hypothetical protein
MLVIIISYSFGVYFLFERNTRACRQLVSQLLAKSHSNDGPKGS